MGAQSRPLDKPGSHAFSKRSLSIHSMTLRFAFPRHQETGRSLGAGVFSKRQ
jgi:hypothetical protein